MRKLDKMYLIMDELSRAIYTGNKLSRDRVISMMLNEEDEHLSETMFDLFQTAMEEFDRDAVRFMLDGFKG